MGKQCCPDRLAAYLIYMAKLARTLGPSWDAIGLTHFIAGLHGEYIGKVLPGKGIYLDFDLKRMSPITKSLPFVFERTPVQKWNEMFDDERLAIELAMVPMAGGTITSYDGIINARAGGNAEDIVIMKTSFTTSANEWFDMFLSLGTPDGGLYTGTTPPTGTALNKSTTGAWSLGLTNPTGVNKKYFLTLGLNSNVAINFGVLVDILTESGSFRLTVATAETVATPPTLLRYTTGAGVQMTLVVTTASSATAHTLTVTYMNQAGTAGQAVSAFAPATATITPQLAYPTGIGSPFVGFQSGDYGAREFKQTQSNVALAAGALTGLLVYPLAFIPGVAANTYVERDSTVQIDGLTELVLGSDSALGCLGMFINTGTTASGAFKSFIRTCTG